MKTTMMVALLAGLAAGMSAAQDIALPGDAEAGRAIYERYCTSCHGLEGTGHGPMRAVLTIQPTDLTALGAGGAFPLERVVKRIDGRDPLVAHGSPMPVYGDFFETGAGVALRTEAGQPVMTSEPVADLVAYIRSMQGG